MRHVTTTMPQPFSHCSFCGQRFASDVASWPRTCAACTNISYRNPLPVAVVLVPVDGGIVLVRRNIEPRRGQLALPGGFINYGESWQTGGAREVQEETGIVINPDSISTFAVHSTPDSTVLIFGLAKPLTRAQIPAFVPTDETSESVIVTAPTQLAFPLHTNVLADYFTQPRSR
jgi:ADP-ribose pyrophosphatase YjhB (NUDIX family)